MGRIGRNLTWTLLILAGLSLCAWGQVITSSIVGSVVDASGAVLPGVTITVTNVGTGISVETLTDKSGTYSVTNLLAGTYSVTAVKNGFRTFRVTGLGVQTAATVRQNVVMQVGAVHQTVQVSGAAPLIQTDSPTISDTLTARQITDLPFQLQSIDTLTSLVPGAQTAWGASNPQTGGATHYGGDNFTLNGISVNDPGNGGSSYSYSEGLSNLPDLSSMQEFQVQDGSMSAQYRDAGVVTMVTKQGTNQFHGSAYEYNENSSLNANTFIQNAHGEPRSFDLVNQFGANFGGPIKKTKAFFFFDYAGLRQSKSPVSQVNVPSVAERQGNFSALCSSYSAAGICNAPGGTQLYNPSTGSPFTGNIIPANLITSQAKTLLTYVPAPTSVNSPGLPNEAPNYVSPVPIHDVMNSYTFRGDYQISSSDRLFAVWNRNVGSPEQVFLGPPATYGNASNYGYNDNSINVSETHIFSPTVLNEVRIGWFDHASIRAGQNLNFDPTSLFPQLTPSPNRGLPTMTMTGYEQIGDHGAGYFEPAYDAEISDDLTLIHGSHTIKAGIDETGYKEYVPNPFASLGSFGFSGQWTGNKGWPGQPQSKGNAFADFLLGTANSSSTSLAGADQVAYNRDWEFYAQDTWQASRKLTIYYGLRYMYQSPWNIRDHMETFLNIPTDQLVLPENTTTPTLPPGASAALFAAYPFTTTAALGMPESYFTPQTNNWGPRFGFAYRPFSSTTTVVRGGFGIYYNYNPYFVGPQQDTLNPPWGGATLNFSSALPGSPKGTFLPDITFGNPFPSTNKQNNVSANPTINMMDRNFMNPMAKQWTLTLEHQFGPNWMAGATYLGSQTHHIQWFQRDINEPAVQEPDVTTQNQRPLKPWANIPGTRTGAKQNFNQLQLELQKRFAAGLMLQAEYEWTSSLDDAAFSVNPQKWHFPNLDYGNTSFVRRHNLVVNYVYHLPVGRGSRFLSNAHGVENAVLGGWQFAGITSYGTGLPFSVGFQVPSTYSCCWWGGSANRANSVAGANPYAGQSSSHNITSGVTWFDTSAFAPPQPYQFGCSERDGLFGPGYGNWDMSAMKVFNLPHFEQARLQIRADFFDAFNHFNLANPSATIADTRDGGPPVPTAGKIFSGSGNRVIQIGARLQF